MSTPAVVEAFAPAKVNLALRLRGKRADGYHEIDTWMLALDWGDTLTLARSQRPGIRLRVHGPHASADIPSDERNLAWRAVQLVLARRSQACGIDIELKKAVPSQAGLGAGSADAAAAWLAAGLLLGLESTPEQCSSELGSLGSDCVFFARAAATGLAHCTGRGELVTPHALPHSTRSLALIVPPLACPTAAVYRAVQLPANAVVAPLTPSAWFDAPLESARARIENVLEAAALRAVPELCAWREALVAAGAGHWRLSGSGSTFFALHDSAAAARAELDRLAGILALRGLFPRASQVASPLGAGAKTWTIS